VAKERLDSHAVASHEKRKPVRCSIDQGHAQLALEAKRPVTQEWSGRALVQLREAPAAQVPCAQVVDRGQANCLDPP
jgi:hypothetical protein